MSRPSLRPAVLATLLVLSGACREDKPDPGVPVTDAGTRAPDAGLESPDSGTPDAGSEPPDSGTPDAGSGFAAGGSLTPAAGKQVPASAKVMVVWSLSGSAEDYPYKFGEGASSGASFTLPMSTPPPVQALNQGELGVGLILLMPMDYSLADGFLTRESTDELFAKGLGGAGQFALIYKATSETSFLDWAKLFPVGYSCGKGVEAPPESSFDTFEPVPCESLGITVDDLGNIEFVNWT